MRVSKLRLFTLCRVWTPWALLVTVVTSVTCTENGSENVRESI